MIQRIQSIYFLLTAILMAVAIFCPLIEFSNHEILFSLGVMSKNLHITWGIVSIFSISALLAFINIFLFKKRKIQIKIGYATNILIILSYITIGVYACYIQNKTDLSIETIGYGFVLPLIAFIFNTLGIIGVKKDEKKVRSLDRIR